ncbi:MAG: ABC transporter permease [Streptosporangiales bacterium]|nr:ABC transporter permease [Streptosporangiales bacterium]
MIGTDVEVVHAPEAATRPGRPAWIRLVLLGVALFVALSAVRVITGSDQLTSSGTMGAALGLAVPIGMAALGGLWSERSGVINIGLEGMLILGTWFGAWGAYVTGNPWAGLVAGVVGGMLGALLHALATVTFGVDHIVSGVALTILATGLARYLSVLTYLDVENAGASQSPPIKQGFPRWSLPGADSALGQVEAERWFLVSDLAGLIRGLTTNVSAVTVIAVALVPISYWVLWRTAFGLRLRSCGENPVAAASLGVGVRRLKYAAVIVSGGLAGLGGVFLSMVATSQYQEGQTNGRGYIGLAAMIFGNWRPGGLAAGAGMFGYTDAVQLRGSAVAVHALLLLAAVGLVALAAWQVSRRRYLPAAVSFAVGVAVYAWYATTDSLPGQIVTYTPHITTLLVLSLAAQRLRMPAANGMRYRKGEE